MRRETGNQDLALSNITAILLARHVIAPAAGLASRQSLLRFGATPPCTSTTSRRGSVQLFAARADAAGTSSQRDRARGLDFAADEALLARETARCRRTAVRSTSVVPTRPPPAASSQVVAGRSAKGELDAHGVAACTACRRIKTEHGAAGGRPTSTACSATRQASSSRTEGRSPSKLLPRSGPVEPLRAKGLRDLGRAGIEPATIGLKVRCSTG